MRITIVLLGLLMELGLPTPSHAGSPSCDISTDQGLRTAYRELTGTQLSTSCVRRSRSFPGMVRVGTYLEDSGCRWEMMLYDCQIDVKNVTRNAMAAAGWTKADAKQREKLALDWLTNIDGIIPESSEPVGWKEKHKTFQPPQSTPTANGGLELKYWVRDPPNSRKMTTFHLQVVTFASDGTQSPTKQLEAFTVELAESLRDVHSD